MSGLEGNHHVTSLVVGPLGLYRRRKNQGLHRTIKVFPLGDLPSEPGLSRESVRSGSSAHWSTRDPVDLRKYNQGLPGSGQTLLLSGPASPYAKYHPHTLPRPHHSRQTFRRRPLIVARIKPDGGHHAATLEGSIEPHNVQPLSHSRG